MESIFETKEQYLEMRKQFKLWYNKEDRSHATAYTFALYAAFRGKDWRKCFTANTRPDKIEAIEGYLHKCKPQYMELTPWGNTITEDMILQLRENGLQQWGE